MKNTTARNVGLFLLCWVGTLYIHFVGLSKAVTILCAAVLIIVLAMCLYNAWAERRRKRK